MSCILSTVEECDSHADSVPIPPPIPDPRFAFLLLCGVIAIERFAFYLLFSLFTLYLLTLNRTEAEATIEFGLFTSVMYFAPLVGGFVAVRAGRWPTILFGVLLLGIGYLALGIGLSVSVSLAFLATGTGLFKGNITALVGSLFLKSERDVAYSRFYWAVNLGSLPSGIVGAWLSSHYGFRAAFLLCFAVMALVIPFGVLFRDSFCDAAIEHESVQHHTTDRERVITILVLLPVAMLFFCAFYQTGTSLTLFAKNNTQPVLFGIPITPPVYQSIHPALVLLLTPILVRLFRRWPLTTWRKLSLGMGLCSLSCLVMMDASVVASFASSQGRVSPLWLIGSYALLSSAELCVSPLGFSLVSKLSPPKYAGSLMGLWMAAIALGNLATGFLGILWERWPHSSFFAFLTGLSALAIPLLWTQRQRLERVLGGSREH
ncbi:MAG: peptide MFS transporter [Myxococcales bacterium]|nr:peptide MFS transporter [Myxococcales bacterium]